MCCKVNCPVSRRQVRVIRENRVANSENSITKTATYEKGSKVEADVAMCPLLSLFRREENRDGDTYVPYALHNY